VTPRAGLVQPDVMATRARATLALADRTLHIIGDLAGARILYGQAHGLAVRTDDAELVAAAAIGLGGLWVRERRAAADASATEARQLAALRSLDPSSTLALRLRARLTAEEDYRNSGCQAILAIVEEARRRGEPLAAAEALSLAHHCMLGPGHAPARLTIAHELLRVGSMTGRTIDVLMGLLWRTVDLFLVGDAHAERSYAELEAYERQHRHRAVGYVIAAIRVMLTIRRGELGEAERLAMSCADRGRSAGDEDADGWYAGQLVAIRWYQGRHGELAGFLADAANSPVLSPVDNALLAAQSVVAAAAGDTRQARVALAKIRGADLADLPRSISWLTAIGAVIEAAALLDDKATAARAYDLLLPFAQLPLVADLGAACFGVAHHQLGVASLCVGRAGRAVEHLRAAVCGNTALGHWPAITLSKARLGQALLSRGRQADFEEAEALFTEASADAAELGMTLPASASLRLRKGRTAACIRRGRRWRVELGGRSVLVEDSVGIRHLAILMANPGVDVSAVDLTCSVGPRGHSPGRIPQQVLDVEALRNFRSRLQDVRKEIAEADAAGNLDRAGELRSDADWLVGELQAHTGLGGRPRAFTDETERARIAVGKAIRRALDRINSADSIVGAELRAATQTGTQCCYHPDWPANDND
jgi:hypothetical protein